MKYKSDVFEVIHQSASEKFQIGAISESKMREYDEMCLVPEAETSAVFNTVNETTNLENTGLITA